MKSLIIDKEPLWLDEIPSTNTFLLELCRKNQAVHGKIVAARTQTAGRGQLHAAWMSQPGASLTFSVAFYTAGAGLQDELPSGQVPLTLFNMAVALGVTDYARWRNLPRPAIKWPNDLMSYEKKWGGILIENLIKNGDIQWIVTGIGLNLNQTEFPAFLPNATSLYLETGNPYAIDQELRLLTDGLNRRLQQWNSGLYHKIEQDYLESLLGYGQWRFYRINGGDWIEARSTGISPHGLLRLELPDGTETESAIRELEWKLDY